MARGDIFSARVERIAAGGAGIARVDGKSVFIGMTAPGDLARFRIEREHRNWAEGELLEVLEASPRRTGAECPFYGRCGGCSLQHLRYDAQIEAKTAILKDAFTRIGGIDPPEPKIRVSRPYGYRNRVQFHAADDGAFPGGIPSAAGVGFKERNSSRVTALTDCPVADRGIRQALRAGTLTAPAGKKRFTVYSRFDTFLSEGGKERGLTRILDKTLVMDTGVFFQSNGDMLELLVSDLLSVSMEADRNLPLADIYCGVGTFAAFIGGSDRAGPGFPAIDLVEENRNALALARENMPPGKPVNYFALSDTGWAKKHAKGNYGFMILDPPREGLPGPMREWLALAGPELTAYVSCDPATLARDSRRLVEGGYVLDNLYFYDFYPQTAHLESLAVFRRELKKGN